MSLLVAALVPLLEADVALMGLLTGGFHPVQAPQSTLGPYCVFRLKHGACDYELFGPDEQIMDDLCFEALAADYLVAHQISGRIEALLRSVRGLIGTAPFEVVVDNVKLVEQKDADNVDEVLSLYLVELVLNAMYKLPN